MPIIIHIRFLPPMSGGFLVVPSPTPRTFSETKTQRKISERRAAKGRPGRPEQPSGPRAPRMEAGEPWEVDLEEPFFHFSFGWNMLEQKKQDLIRQIG